MITGVHAVGLAVLDVERSAAAYGAAVPLELVDRDRSVLLRGPNVHLELSRAQRGAPPRAVNDAGIAHLCLQGRDMGRLRGALEDQRFTFLSAPVALGTGYLYAYGRDPDGLLIETEGAPFAPDDVPGWFGHVALVTPGLERLAAFYAALTDRSRARGMRLRGSVLYDTVTGLPDVDLTAAWVPIGAFSLEFWSYANPPTGPAVAREGAPGWTHITFESDDVGADYRRAIDLGARPEQPPADDSDGESASIRDPDGNLVRLVRWTGEARRLSIEHLTHPDILARVQQAREAAAA